VGGWPEHHRQNNADIVAMIGIWYRNTLENKFKGARTANIGLPPAWLH